MSRAGKMRVPPVRRSVRAPDRPPSGATTGTRGLRRRSLFLRPVLSGVRRGPRPPATAPGGARKNPPAADFSARGVRRPPFARGSALPHLGPRTRPCGGTHRRRPAERHRRSAAVVSEPARPPSVCSRPSEDGPPGRRGGKERGERSVPQRWGPRLDRTPRRVPSAAVGRRRACSRSRRWRQRTTATWLILPVVICLSQRLSHAGLSTGPRTAKLRMAH